MDFRSEALKELKAINAQLSNKLSDWCDEKEACIIVGFFGKTGNRKLRKLRQSGWITKFQNTRPISFYRPELYDVSNKISKGEIII